VTDGERARVAYVLAIALGTVLVIIAITALWAVIGGATLGEDVSKFLTITLGAVIGALAAYIGARKGGE
jgi:uncharacterized membrane protein YdjX (TVP38/TMEM64 family)